MAGTLLSAPTLGDSDWSPWITLVDACRRGYLAASYTNFSGSAVSALAAGSLVEVAGAVYSFTETAITYTGAGSTNSDLYIYVKPDAAVSTCSVVAWGSAPVWVDAKQGFYASAASTTRAIGGMYVKAAGGYSNKYLYTGENLDICVQRSITRPILRNRISMGEWNMAATTSLTIALTEPDVVSKIRHLDGVIFDDTGITYAMLHSDNSGVALSAGISIRALTTWVLSRSTGSIWDGSGFNGTASTVANRGYVYVEYEA